MGSEATQLLQVQGGETGQALGPVGAEAKPHGPRISGVLVALHQTGRHSAVDQLDRAVMADQQVASHVPDGRSGTVRMSADREQELVLRWSNASRRGLVGTPTQEPAQPGAKVEQPLVMPLLQRHDPTLSCGRLGAADLGGGAKLVAPAMRGEILRGQVYRDAMWIAGRHQEVVTCRHE